VEKDWQHELKRHPMLLALEQARHKKQFQLRHDKQFVLESERLRTSLEKALVANPRIVREFFRQFSRPVGVRLKHVHAVLQGLESRKLRALFERYIVHVARFGVVMWPHKTRARFLTEVLVPWGARFHVRLIGGHFEPAKMRVDPDTPFEYFFESDDVRIPEIAETQIKKGRIKFAQIEDQEWSSVLSKLEYFAYDPESLTFVLHNAEQPYLFCLIGEKISDETWRRASKIRSAFLKQCYGRGTAGRPPNIPRLRESIKLRKSAGPLKDKVTPSGDEAKSFHSAYSYLSRLGKQLRQQNSSGISPFRPKSLRN
jgi:hypothetical protein